jgi:hypothetical protein
VANIVAMSTAERVRALLADVEDLAPLRALDRAAGLKRGSFQKIASEKWKDFGEASLPKLCLFFAASDYIVFGGRKPARERVRAAVQPLVDAERRRWRQGRVTRRHAPTLRAP